MIRRPPEDSGKGPEASEIAREMFGTFAHDLGGIASALALRTDALASLLPPRDSQALGAIVDEIRTLARVLRHVRGPRGTEQLAPSTAGDTTQWWNLVERVARSALPRGVGLRSTVANARLTAEQAHTLTYLVLALFHDLTTRGLAPPAMVSLTVSAHGPVEQPDVAIDVRPERTDGTAVLLTQTSTRWLRYARRVAGRIRAEIASDGDVSGSHVVRFGAAPELG
ncbi:MAG: hypothetical protein ACT4P7_06335 [Gemmatimonadaceae bacterium]